jgi:hypothetical protein
MINKKIIKEYKAVQFHLGFDVLYGKELDKHVVPRLPLDFAEKELVLAASNENNVHLDDYTISINANR